MGEVGDECVFVGIDRASRCGLVDAVGGAAPLDRGGGNLGPSTAASVGVCVGVEEDKYGFLYRSAGPFPPLRMEVEDAVGGTYFPEA